MVMVWIGWKRSSSMSVLLGVAIGQLTGKGWDELRAALAKIVTTLSGSRSKMFICIGWEGADREPSASTGAGGLGARPGVDAPKIGETVTGRLRRTACGVPEDRRGLERRSLARVAADHHFGCGQTEGSPWLQSGSGPVGLSGSPGVGPQILPAPQSGTGEPSGIHGQRNNFV